MVEPTQLVQLSLTNPSQSLEQAVVMLFPEAIQAYLPHRRWNNMFINPRYLLTLDYERVDRLNVRHRPQRLLTMSSAILQS